LARKAEAAPSAPAAAKKRKISAEGMKRIIAATKKRWAAVRAQQAVVVKGGAKLDDYRLKAGRFWWRLKVA
jgi:hypothetical protein